MCCIKSTDKIDNIICIVTCGKKSDLNLLSMLLYSNMKASIHDKAKEANSISLYKSPVT